MPIYELNNDKIELINRTTFSAEGIKEREDLQRLLRDQISLLADGVMVLAEEFSDWADSNRRIDLLCLDNEANFVVIELKRTSDGGHMELQALRYSAMISTMTFDQAVAAHTQYLMNRGFANDARSDILNFLGWEESDEERFGSDVRIVLVSEGFSREITTTVMWLNERDLDIRCVRLTPYTKKGRILLDIQQVIPLPEAADYQVRIKEKEQRRRSSGRRSRSTQEIWEQFDLHCVAQEVATVRALYPWLEEHFDEVFNTRDAFAPKLHDESCNQYFLKITYLGHVEIWFQYLAAKKPFDSETLREELRNRLNKISGVDIPRDRISGKPKFPLSAIVAADSLDKFKDVMVWMRDLVHAQS